MTTTAVKPTVYNVSFRIHSVIPENGKYECVCRMDNIRCTEEKMRQYEQSFNSCSANKALDWFKASAN